MQLTRQINAKQLEKNLLLHLKQNYVNTTLNNKSTWKTIESLIIKDYIP